jgi:DNA-directed RNA polymerase subunit M/transcription elongation factor TFIIS
MDLICNKPYNVKKLETRLRTITDCERSHVLSQIHWDMTERSMSLKEVYKFLGDGKYGWAWYDVPEKIVEMETLPGALECSRCSSRRIKTRVVQTRSCDEGATVFAQCSECKLEWSFRG